MCGLIAGPALIAGSALIAAALRVITDPVWVPPTIKGAQNGSRSSLTR